MKLNVAIENRVMRAAAAILLSLVCSGLAFLIFGILIPMLGLRTYYGTGDEANGPGITVLLVPMGVAVICVAAGCALTKVFYQSWSPRSPDHTGR
jgi:hypothetical protein